jgi:hypothetical protein
MKERPILFSTPMVKAILAGQKTQTRRVAKFVPLEGKDIYLEDAYSFLNLTAKGRYPLPFVGRFTSPDHLSAEHLSEDLNLAFGNNGDRLWVRETFTTNKLDNKVQVYYSADRYAAPPGTVWKPSIFMPREISRITLEITEQRIERLKALTDEGAKAEGFNSVEEFKTLWDKLNAKRGYEWDVNPWVWVISFKRIGAV